MDSPVNPSAGNRLRWLVRLTLVWALVVVGRLVFLQVVNHEEYRDQAVAQQTRFRTVPALRGSVFDRTGKRLAISIPVDTVTVNPQLVPDVSLAANMLAGVLDFDSAKLEERLKTFKANRKGYCVVAKRVPPDKVARLRDLQVNWIDFEHGTRRFYPNGALAAHMLGGVDHDDNGNAGIEFGLNDELAGHEGYVRVLTDVKHRGFDTEEELPALEGHDVVLTIDRRIQYVAEAELAKAVLGNDSKSGSVVVMNPHTGEILALANYPSFDPNAPPQNDAERIARKNLAVSDPVEPGSVFKVFTLASALETTDLTPDSRFHCGNGKMTLFGRVIHDHDPYGWLSMTEVLAKSSNIGAIRIGIEVGKENLHAWVRRFGFGEPTGIPLPAESAGRVFRLSKWDPSSIGSVAMGHEVLTTTMQLAQGVSVIANGGLMVRPRLTIPKAHQGSGFLLASFDGSQPKPERVLKPETAIILRQMMEQVVLAGTGKTAKLRGYSSGGKTGTAQIFDTGLKKYTHKYNASFMGFAPLTNPAVTVVVTLNGASKYGGIVSGPVFREIAAAALRVMNVPMDVPDDAMFAELQKQAEREQANDLAVALNTSPFDDEEEPVEAANTFSTGPRVPDFTGKALREVLEEATSLGLKVEVRGDGIARFQQPRPGRTLLAGQQVKVQFYR